MTNIQHLFLLLTTANSFLILIIAIYIWIKSSSLEIRLRCISGDLFELNQKVFDILRNQKAEK